LIEEIFSLIKENFSNFEVVFNFDEEYNSDIQLCIRTTNYKENNLFSLISKVENKIIDIEDESNSTINILLYTDYKKPEFLDGIS
jgi:thermostable 8-oxoguanine DNA glycosylase